MISYELALKLKEYGFPQHEGCTAAECYETICVPTLSELIEACGVGFNELRKIELPEGWYWKCSGWLPKFDNYVYVLNKTPEEAVANLWLSLHNIGNEKEATS